MTLFIITRDSPISTMPWIATPTAPIPTQTAEAVFNVMVLMAIFSNQILIAITETVEGDGISSRPEKQKCWCRGWVREHYMKVTGKDHENKADYSNEDTEVAQPDSM